MQLITFTLTFTSLPPPAFPPLFIIIFSLLLPLIHLTRGYHKIRRKYESRDETSILHLFFHPGQPGDQAKQQLGHLQVGELMMVDPAYQKFIAKTGQNDGGQFQLTESHSLT